MSAPKTEPESKPVTEPTQEQAKELQSKAEPEWGDALIIGPTKLEPSSLEHSDNLFWVDEMALERLEQTMGMSVMEGVEEDATEAVLVAQVQRDVEKGPEESDDEFLERMWQRASIWREEKTQREILLTETLQDPLVDHLLKIIQRAQRARERAKGPVDIQMLNNQTTDERHPSAQRRVNVPRLPTPNNVEIPSKHAK
ncbi:Retrovirus-related Pol polyprotein from transposon [Ceratobasidium sp. AG-Ba]|nr:Retrovirus-related Pol polyprotein from transposon [Ceratobasidium sp. AG-Ba]